MKKLVTLIMFFAVTVIYSQTALSAGDIAIFGVNTDNPDDFGFVLLVDVQAGTEIRFTDSGWKSDNTFRGNEGAVKWTAPSNLSKGTEITYQGNNSDFVTDNDATVGTNGLTLSGSGDQVFAFQGASTSPTFIYAVQTNSNVWQSDATASTNSAIPQGLTDGTNAVAVGAGSGAGDEYDNAGYDKSTMTGTSSEILAAVSDNSHWTGDNSNRFDLTTYDFTVNNSTPVELTSFTANVKGNKVELNWATATEVNNYGFEVLRSTENSGWTTIGFVQGHGSSNSPKYYTYVDNPIDKGFYSYKLKQIDLDGAFKFSDVVSVDLGSVTKFALKQNYPNPFNPTTEISFDIPKESNVRLSVYNSLGQKVADLLNEKLSAGTHRVNFDGSNLTSGIYFYKMESGGFTDIKKMILMK